jgi:hypothetical protein
MFQLLMSVFLISQTIEGIGKINNLSWESDSTFSNYSYSVDVLGTKTNFVAKEY